MRRLRTTSTRRLYAVAAAVVALAAGGGIAQAALSGLGDTPEPKPLDRAVHDALTAPAPQGVTARIEFTNDLLPAGSLPDGAVSPLAAGAEGRLWMSGERFRLELQSDAGDAQITSDGERLSVYDTASDAVYVLALPEEERQHEQPSLDDIGQGLDRLARVWTLSGAQPTNTAGRPSYTLRMAPKDDGGLLGAAELAWDAANGVPLRAGVYAQGQEAPVLELEVTDVDFGPIADADLAARPPAGAEVVEVDPTVHDDQGVPTRVRGVEAVRERLDFPLAAPAELAGLPRKDVRLVQAGDRLGAVSVYGEGMGAIVVLQREGGPTKPALELPQVNIDGATGIELATALGTVVTFERDGVSYTVAGSVPPIAAENAARELR